MTPSLSAAICTRNRSAQLRRALVSLAGQGAPLAEILVIDNAPDDDATERLIACDFPEVRYLAEPRLGLDIARNHALREAKGEIVAFLDDDAVADCGWSAAIQGVFAGDSRVSVCTGRVEALSADSEGAALFEANGGFSRGTDRISLPADVNRPLHGRRAPLIAWAISIGSGCSLAVRRDWAIGAGGFDEALDLKDATIGGGDLDIIWRALAAGRNAVYEPRALAWHEHRPDRAGVVNQLAGHQRGVISFLSKHLAGDTARAEIAAFLGWRLLKPGVRLVRRAAGRDPLPASALLRMWWNCLRGLYAYPLARRALARRAHGSAAPSAS